jgi:hypothetical protein
MAKITTSHDIAIIWKTHQVRVKKGQATKNPSNIRKVSTHNGLHHTFNLTFRLQWEGIEV